MLLFSTCCSLLTSMERYGLRCSWGLPFSMTSLLVEFQRGYWSGSCWRMCLKRTWKDAVRYSLFHPGSGQVGLGRGCTKFSIFSFPVLFRFAAVIGPARWLFFSTANWTYFLFWGLGLGRWSNKKVRFYATSPAGKKFSANYLINNLDGCFATLFAVDQVSSSLHVLGTSEISVLTWQYSIFVYCIFDRLGQMGHWQCSIHVRWTPIIVKGAWPED